MSRIFSLFLLALIGLTAPSWASIIYVFGDQTGTWAADTVIVFAEVRVPPGQTLTIQPGVEVLFLGYLDYYKLIVDQGATLTAVGTVNDSIRFDVLTVGTHWHGIRFLGASNSSRLEYCILKNGQATGNGEDAKGGAIYCSNSSLTIIHSTLQSNSASWGGAICCTNNSNPTISGNTISGDSASSFYGGYGGGIYCDGSSPTISDNTINDNFEGGIGCWNNSNPIISGNTISGNSASSGWGGGIYCYNNSSPIITSNTVSGNSTYIGGGIYCHYSSPTIIGNTISGNSASSYGGGISCYYSSSTISNNTISGNSTYIGGGIYCHYSSPTIIGNTISGNSASSYGGGISCCYFSPIIIGNTISGNVANDSGGGIYCGSSNPTLVNCILWSNTSDQISGSTPRVNYSDIQGGYSGTGNIDVWPAFVDTAQSDYRLQWGSPCIDSGDPNPLYNDPDNTRADMGAWYYDQSMPVRILLTPYNTPIQIPAIGGSFQYNIQVTNIGSTSLPTLGWCNVTLPSGAIYGPVLGPLTISLGAGQTVSRLRTQVVPASAPAGMYHYNAFAVAAGDTSEDSFTFTKLGIGDWGLGIGGWTNTGEEFDVGARHAVPMLGSGPEGGLRSATPTTVISPNPFNPTTTISFELRAASFVNLKVYDTAGRLVATLVDGWRETGTHELTFEAGDLPSGVYFCRMQAGDFSAVQKLILLK